MTKQYILKATYKENRHKQILNLYLSLYRLNKKDKKYYLLSEQKEKIPTKNRPIESIAADVNIFCWHITSNAGIELKEVELRQKELAY